MDGIDKSRPRSKKISLSNKEKVALIKAFLIKYIPLLFGLILCFTLAMLFTNF